MIGFIKKHPYLSAFGVIIIILAVFFSPVFLKNKVPLNANFLVAFYNPYKYQKFPGFIYGVPAKQGGGYDTIRLGYPYFGLVAESWKNLKIPLWNPYNFAGLPLAAETQSAAFYPLYIFTFIFNQINLWILFTVSGFLLAFMLCFWFLYDKTRNFWAGLLGAFGYTFSTFFIVWNQEVVTCLHAACWLPLILLSIDKLFQKPQIRWWLTLTLSLILSLLSGYIQVTFYVFLFSGIYSLYQFFKFKPRKMGLRIMFLLGIALVSTLGLTLFQTLPLQEMQAFSSRNIIDMKEFLASYLLPLYSPIQFFIPEFFGSSGTWNHYGFPAGTFYEHSFATCLPIVIFAIYALLIKSKFRDKWFFAVFGVISLLSALDLVFNREIFNLKIPLLSTSIANRILFLPAFCLSVLAAYGIAGWTAKKSFKTGLLTALIVIILFLIGPAWALGSKFGYFGQPANFPDNWTKIALRNSLIPGAVLVMSLLLILLATWRKKLTNFALLIIFILGVSQIGYFFFKVTAFSPREFVYPQHPGFQFLQKQGNWRFLGFHGADIENNLASQLRLYSPEGYDSLANSRWQQFLKAAESKGVWTDQLSRSDAGLLKSNEEFAFDQNPVRLRILQLTSVKYILYRPKDSYINELQKINDYPPQAPDFVLTAKTPELDIFEYQKTLPRVFFVARATVIENNNQAIFDQLFSSGFDPHKEVILEKEVTADIEPDMQANAQITSYNPGKIQIKAQTDTYQWLILTDAYYPGWEAYIDNDKTEILRADFALQAILVPPGEHKIEFVYRPVSFKTGLQLSLITLLAVGLVIFDLAAKKKKS